MTLDKARALVGDAALWPLVRDFLWDFAPQVHRSWLEGRENLEFLEKLELLEQRAPASGQEQRSGLAALDSPRIKRHILSALGVEPFFHDFPKDDWSRLALLDGATLESIAKWLGALACADRLRRVTGGAEVRQLKAALPGVYPDVFSFTAYFTGLDSAAADAKEAKSPEEVFAAGFALLSSQLDACPPLLVSRFRLKFPASLVSGLSGSGRESRDGRPASALKKLLKLKFPEAYKICC